MIYAAKTMKNDDLCGDQVLKLWNPNITAFGAISTEESGFPIRQS